MHHPTDFDNTGLECLCWNHLEQTGEMMGKARARQALATMEFTMDQHLWGFVAPGALVLLIVRHLCRWRHQRMQSTIRRAQEERRQELLQRLTFLFSSLRHSYNKYAPDLLPPDLQAERQAFLEHDFRNLTTLSALSLVELEDLFATVQRECTTGKWRGGVSAIEQRVEEATRRTPPLI
jgi:hypothetical protein